MVHVPEGQLTTEGRKERRGGRLVRALQRLHPGRPGAGANPGSSTQWAPRCRGRGAQEASLEEGMWDNTPLPGAPPSHPPEAERFPTKAATSPV